jgi:SAM-dependent methyltransferase
MARVYRCLVCGSDDTAFNLKCKDHLTGGGNFDIFSCKKCGFTFTTDPPGETDIEKYYDAGDYISHSDTKKGLTNNLFHFTRSLMLFRKRNIIRKLTGLKTGTLLDIGCGTGYFAAFMKKGEWEVTGVEKNEGARRLAIEKFGLNVVNESEIAGFREETFDCITLWHVFEHIHDPVKYLPYIRRVLKPRGVCVIAMPNCSSFDAKHYREYWAAWDVPRHLWHFTPGVFRTFAEKNGFEVKGIKRLPADVFYISILSERYRGTNIPFLQGLIKGLWFSLLTLFNKKGSSSLIYILKA